MMEMVAITILYCGIFIEGGELFARRPLRRESLWRLRNCSKSPNITGEESKEDCKCIIEMVVFLLSDFACLLLLVYFIVCGSITAKALSISMLALSVITYLLCPIKEKNLLDIKNKVWFCIDRVLSVLIYVWLGFLIIKGQV